MNTIWLSNLIKILLTILISKGKMVVKFYVFGQPHELYQVSENQLKLLKFYLEKVSIKKGDVHLLSASKNIGLPLEVFGEWLENPYQHTLIYSGFKFHHLRHFPRVGTSFHSNNLQIPYVCHQFEDLSMDETVSLEELFLIDIDELPKNR